ncbi:MAG: hypothetical protein WD066_11235 [Planctomycetaceae bacterium]
MTPRPLARVALRMLVVASAIACSAIHSAQAAALPGKYFEMLRGEAERGDERPGEQPAAGARGDRQVGRLASLALGAAVLYAKEHADNPSHGDKEMLARALRAGDQLHEASVDGRFSRLNWQWDVALWLDAYRLLEKDLGDERRAKWKGELERLVRIMAREVAPRVDAPRYQSPYLITSPNHFSIWSSTVHLAGKVFGNKEWEELGARVMHRYCATEQAPDGYWGEHNMSGPTTGYNFLTTQSVALYYEHSGDPVAKEALRRVTTFHANYTWPNGHPVEVINDRNRSNGVRAWAHFGFSNFPDGRRYAEYLVERMGRGDGGGRVAQNALYWHDGDSEPIGLDKDQHVHRMSVPAGMRKSGPWTYCLSGLISTLSMNRYYMARQGHVGIYHEKTGQIVTGANSKRQPELATFMVAAEGETRSTPLDSKLEMSDGTDPDALTLAYDTFYAVLRVPRPEGGKLRLRADLAHTAARQSARMTLQLILHPGEELETAAGGKYVLGEEKLELGPEQLGGWIKHHGWKIELPDTARLDWPVYPYNPYADARETSLSRAVGALWAPVQLRSGGGGPRNVGQRIEFVFDVPAGE